MKKERVIVVGGGVIGVCCSYFLTKRGLEVTLIERNQIGSGASSGNAGSVAVGHAPINKPGRMRYVLRELFNRRSPFRVPLRWDPSLAKWLWEYRGFCNTQSFEKSTNALSSLGHATLALFDSLVDEEDLQCGYRRDGFFEVCLTKSALERVESDVRNMACRGYSPIMKSGDQLREIEPALRKEILGGAYFPEGATCDPSRFLLGMARTTEQSGARFLLGGKVTEVLNEHDDIRGVKLETGEVIEAEKVILSTGSYSQRLTQKFGFQLPIQPGKGYHRDVRFSLEGAPEPEQTFLMSEASVYCSPMGEFTRFAGTIEFAGMSHELNRERLDYTTSVAAKYLHGVEESEVISEWTGLRPCTPDGLPCIGAVPGYSGLFLATGHATLGLTLAPITGKIIEQCVLGGTDKFPEVQELRVDRFH
ncbi:uncharacterized protein METZ01_LOCUS104182 [marine metagenome]|uniref:FAD dependent oxidoreductase domain-containing protein n=1 Tax=marine metagenome TaxID=408172 RepID=A0A381WGW5_9ZZZZ